MRYLLILVAFMFISSADPLVETLCVSQNHRITKKRGAYYVKTPQGTRTYQENASGLMPREVIDALEACIAENN